MEKNLGVIPLILIMVFTLYFAIPNEINIGYMFIEKMEETQCPGLEGFCEHVWKYKLYLNLLAGLLFIGEMSFIIFQFKKENLI